MSMIRVTLLVFLLGTIPLAQGAEPSMGPVIKDFGPTYPIDDRDVPLREDFVYRAVFDIAAQNAKPGSVNQKLASIARYLNMHARNGIALENMELAVVIHGKAMRSALSNEGE